jgi:hypothetical protein
MDDTIRNDWRTSSYSFANGNCVEVRSGPDEVAAWRKSSYSKASNCPEVGQAGTVVAVRDTKDRTGPVARFPAAAWAWFTADVKAGNAPGG